MKQQIRFYLQRASKEVLAVLLLMTCMATPGLRASVLLVSFQSSDTVHRYNAETGADLGVFASGLNDPSGIGYDPVNQFVYVANYSGNNVRKYSISGTDLGVFISTGLNGPESVLVDPAGNVYVSNYAGQNVKKYNTLGVLQWTFNAPTTIEGLSLASNGDILANYYGGGQIRRISPAGVDLGTFAITGSNPYVNHVDAFGNVYLTEFSPKTVKKFSSAGALITSNNVGYFCSGLAINDNGELLVGDSSNNKIERYDLNLNYIGPLTNTPSWPGYFAIIPEPSCVLLVLFGMAGLLTRRRRV